MFQFFPFSFGRAHTLQQHLIFDFDGTLIDSSPSVLETFAGVLRANNLQPARPLTREIIGPPLPQTLQLLTGIDDKAILAQLAADFRERYDSEGLYATQPYAGVAEMLRQQLDRGGQLHLATNKRERPTLLLLEHFGWRNWFTSVYCVDSRDPPFPNKGEMLLMQLREQGLAASHCFYVGDTRHDEEAAAHAGIPFVAVAWGYGVGKQAVSKGVRMVGAPSEIWG
jgi:phosphoglycolate phosphatase